MLPELNGRLPEALMTPRGAWYWASTPDDDRQALDSLGLTILGTHEARALRRSEQPYVTATIPFDDDSTQSVWLYIEQMTFSRRHSTDVAYTWRFIAQIVGDGHNSYATLAGLDYIVGVVTYDRKTFEDTGAYSILWRPAAEDWDSPVLYPV